MLQRAGEDLLSRRAPEGYADFWAAIVAQPTAIETATISVVVFRLGSEWLAIDTALVREVAEIRPVHRVAHRTHTFLAGIVNIRGQLHLCVALEGLLQMPRVPLDPSRARLTVLEWLEETWVFAASEVAGVVRFPATTLAPPPATLPPPLAALTRGIVPWDEKRVGYLHGAQLIAALKRTIA